MTDLTFKFEQSNGKTIELSIEDAKQLYRILDELFGNSPSKWNPIPNYPMYPIYYPPTYFKCPDYPNYPIITS